MTPADLARTHAAAFTRDRHWTEAEFTALLDDPGALLTGDARAFALGRTVADEAELLTLATDPAERRRGLARAVLAAFEAGAAARGVTEVFLEVAADNAPACALYDAAGYRLIGKRRAYYRRTGAPAADAFMLRKPL